MEHLQVSEAQRVVLESVVVFGAERVKLEQSLGRVLAEDICANRDLPPYDISAMDGYALRSADLGNIHAALEVIEDIKAGDMPTKSLAPGQCARIMTGAPLPPGADAVIRVEDTEAVPAEALSPSSLPRIPSQQFMLRPIKTMLMKHLDADETIKADLGEIEFDQLGRSMGAYGERVADPAQLEPALRRALASGRCAVVHVDVDPVRHMWAPGLIHFKKMHEEPKG